MISLFFFPYEENPLAGGIPLGDFVFSTEEGVSLLSIFLGMGKIWQNLANLG